ncbi:organic solvent ABC transporter permease [Marinobacter halophilus]|uniref:Organic solvent ABC transporter permease n=1 Tax=Marinobacter halophilus TaxID=1323740 RepID=A0A2T1KGX8_9GAMM|nr:organic solvent ABC transporter permease [Marinobacter halophilus]PSF09375.1 organic solvent ABC transporter permease [Marinobacter halophilus]GGC78422.1 hypothetical protein GCM10011362_28680 [Marinobacter halophilus]
MRFAHLTRLCLLFAAAFTLTGCLDSNSSEGDDTRSGQIHYLGVSGLSYQTASQSGTTDGSGQFRYYPGETLALKAGNLPIVDGVPAQEYVTFLEFLPETREPLQSPGVDDEALRDHQLIEQQQLGNITLLNVTRFLMALNWTEIIADDKGIDIRSRVISQLNAALNDPGLPNSIDFTVNQADFTAEDSPANRLLAAICFYPEDDVLCSEPPTEDAISSAPPRPENDEDIDPDVDYSEDLESLRNRILQAVRTLDEADNERARNYLRRELDAISREVGRRYFLADHKANHPASDTGIKTVKIRKIGGDPALGQLEAISKRPQDVVVHSWSWQDADVDYFLAGSAGGESELLINFRPTDTYRWVRKQIRVIID